VQYKRFVGPSGHLRNQLPSASSILKIGVNGLGWHAPESSKGVVNHSTITPFEDSVTCHPTQKSNVVESVRTWVTRLHRSIGGDFIASKRLLLSCNAVFLSAGVFFANTVKIGKNPTRRIRNLPNTNRGRTCSPTAYKGAILTRRMLVCPGESSDGLAFRRH